MAEDKIELEAQDVLTIKIEHKDAISLSDFKNYLNGWHNQYHQHLSQANFFQEEETLFIKEIKHGSTIVELFSASIPFLNNTNTITSFFLSMKSIINWLATKKGRKPKYTLEDLENIKQIMEPIKTNDSSINFNIDGDNNDVTINYIMKQEINKNINTELEELSLKEEKKPIPYLSEMENMVLKFTQVESAKKNNKNTKGKIAEIDKKPYPILFAEGLKSQINTGVPNPLLINYLVDVKIHVEDDKIKSYTVLKIIDSYEDEIEKSLFPEIQL